MNKNSQFAMIANDMRATASEPFSPNELHTGVILEANTSLFSDAHFNAPLTTYSLGWSNSNPQIEELLEFAAPAVQVPMRFHYRKATNAEAYISEADDIRAIGAEFGTVKYTTTLVNDRVMNKGLTIVEDQDDVVDEPGWEQERVNRIIRRLQLNDYRRAIALLKGGTNDAQTWDGSTGTYGPDPDMGLMHRVVVGNASLGNPGLNRAVFGISAWQARVTAHRKVATAGGFASASMTPTEVARLVGLDDIKLSRELYIATGTTKATVVDTTVGTTGIVLIYNAQSGQSKDDPSSIKRFWCPCKDGSRFRVYRQEFAKTVAITVEHYTKITLVSSTGCQMITVTV
jgi:hypothetical protein